jgi:hypothetical protein
MRAFERDRASAPTPILALTAHALREARERSLEAGCTDHLIKPIKKATLLTAIDKFAPVPRAPERIQVSVESWLAPVVDEYLATRRGDIARLRAALDCGDFAVIRMLGHQMAGTGGGYGFEPITEIGSSLEASALANDASQTRASIDDLDRYLSAVQLEKGV